MCSIQHGQHFFKRDVKSWSSHTKGLDGAKSVFDFTLYHRPCCEDVLVDFVSTWHKLKLLQRKAPPWDSAVRHFLNLWSRQEGPVHCEWCHPLAGRPGFYKKGSWVSQGKQASNIPPWSLHQLLLPDLLGFQFWLSLVTSSDMEM